MAWIMLACVAFIVIGIYIFEKTVTDDAFVPVIVGVFGFLLSFATSVGSYISHADDLGVVRGQESVISVYQEKIGRLEKRLSEFEFQKTGEITLNVDSPIGFIVAALAEAENQLAKAEETRAKAKVSIEKRKAGPWSFIVSWFGDE